MTVDSGSKLEEGGSASGEFQILFDGATSASSVLVHGTFKTENIQLDPWGYGNLEEEQRELNGTPFCGGAAYPD